MPTVDLTLGRVEPPPPSLVVTEPAEDSVLLRGSGFWCMGFVDGKWAGESDCFRYREPCEDWRRRYGKRDKTSECRPAERASCVQVTDYERLGLWYRCFPTAGCEASRAAMISRRPDLTFTECREAD